MKPYTGLENCTDTELVAMTERSDDPLSHELLRRAVDIAEEIEEYKATIKILEIDLEEAKEKTGFTELEEMLGQTRRDLRSAKHEVKKLAAENVLIQKNFNKLKEAYDRRIASLQRQIADAPATW